jgi:hypothetical protein
MYFIRSVHSGDNEGSQVLVGQVLGLGNERFLRCGLRESEAASELPAQPRANLGRSLGMVN